MAKYVSFDNGFKILSAASIDKRLLLTKLEMKTAESLYLLPDTYFAICTDDGKFYLYNKNNEVDAETGKFRVIDNYIDLNNINGTLDGGVVTEE